MERRLFLFVDPNIEGVEVELHSETASFGRCRTDRDGIARWRLPAMPEGLHRLRARLVPESRYRASEAEGYAGVFAPDAPVFITDIDHTIADVSPFGFIVRSNVTVRPLPGAPEALREIAASMRVMYLSARDHIFVAKTRAWLRANGFPEGVLLLRRVRFTSATPLQHKLSRLEDVVARLKNVRCGVGDLPTDVEAYRRRGIPPLLLSAVPLPGIPDDVPRAASWSEIRNKITR